MLDILAGAGKSKSKIEKIEWICTTSGVDITMPVIRASEYKHKWQMKAVQDMKSNGSLSAKHRREWEMQDANLGNKQFNPDDIRHTAKCPALQMWHNTGFILRLHQDLKMRTIGEGEDLTWTTPFQSSKEPLVSKVRGISISVPSAVIVVLLLRTRLA